MVDNLTLILAEFEKYKGQFVIAGMWDIERLVAIGDDKQDYYYITYDGKELKWHTCVGRIMPLKGYLRNEDYNEIVRIAKLNDYDQVDLEENGNINNFLKALNDYIARYDSKHEFLTEFCWDLEYANIKDIRKRKIETITEINSK